MVGCWRQSLLPLLFLLVASLVQHANARDPIFDNLQYLMSHNPFQSAWDFFLGTTEGILSAIVLVVVVFFLWAYRREVIFALTGDEFIHCDWASSCYYCCGRCCGCCEWEWTRKISRVLCCCCPSMQGQNLMKVGCQSMGILPKTVVLQGVVVGDLPFRGIGSFYLQVECGDLPPMRTDVAEDQDPDQVTFMQSFTVKMRDKMLAPSLALTVKDLNVFGSDRVCHVKIPAKRVFRDMIGSRPAGHFKRVRVMMEADEAAKQQNRAFPWISFEIGIPIEYKGQEKYTVHVAKAPGATGRTQLTQPEQQGMLAGCTGAGLDTDVNEENFERVPLVTFKETFKLHDQWGQEVKELSDDEEEYDAKLLYARVVSSLCCLFNVIFVFAIVALRVYLRGCWVSYTHIAQVQEWLADGNGTHSYVLVNATLPIPHDVVQAAKDTHVTDDQIHAVCRQPPTLNDPVAFSQLTHKYLGGHGITCAPSGHNACEWRETFVEWRWVVWTTVVLVTFGIIYYFHCSDTRFARRPKTKPVERTAPFPTNPAAFAAGP